MYRSRFALIKYFRTVIHQAACHTLQKVYLIDEDIVQILLNLKVLFTQDSKVEDPFCGASSGSELSLVFRNYHLYSFNKHKESKTEVPPWNASNLNTDGL